MIKRFLKEEKYTLISFVILISLIFSSYLLGLESFTLGFDYQNQHLYFYEEFHRLLTSGEAPFWSWNLFLGTNFVGSKTYYLLGDPFAYLTLLFPASKMMGALFYITLLKLGVAAFSMTLFLKELNISSRVRFIPTMMYTFCGWAFLFVEHPMYFTTFALLPLLFFAIERYLNRRSVSLVVFSSFILLISNYYLFWSISVFLIFYWPARYFMKENVTIKSFFFDSLKLVGAYLLGACMSLFLILPAAIHTMQNTRLAEEGTLLTKIWRPLKIYLDLIMRAFCPNFDATWDKALLFNTDDYRTNQLTLYSGALTYLFVLSYFFNKARYKLKETWLWLALYAALGLILITPYGGALMHGLSEPTFRWTLLFIMINVTISAKYLNDGKFKPVPLIISSLIMSTLLLLLMFIGSRSYDYLQELQLAEIKVMAIMIGFILAYVLLLTLINKPKYQLTLLAGVLIIELTASSIMTLHRYPTGSEEFVLGGKYDQASFDYLHGLDSTLYRTYTPIRPVDYSLYRNLSLHYNYPSISTYDSMYQFSIADYLSLIGANPSYWGFHIIEADRAKMLGVKYYMIAHHELDLVENLDHLTLIKQFENESLYLDPNYLPMGYTYTNYLSKSEALKLSPADIDWLNTLIIEDEILKTRPQLVEVSERDLFKETSHSNNTLTGTITIHQPSYLFFSIPYDEGWKLTVNGEPKAYESVQGGFIGLFLEDGDYEISLTYLPPGFKIGSIISFISLIGYVIVIAVEIRSHKKNELGF